jgi:glycopeptide antibiotics resistance protein
VTAVLDRRWTLALRTALVVYLAAVLCLTTWPSLEQTSVPSWAEAVVRAAGAVAVAVTVAFVEAASNLVMFVPFGVLVLLLWWGARRRSAGGAWRLVLPVTAVACAFSAAIELSQLAIPGRVSTVQDLVLNTAGALVGALATAAVAAAVGRRAAARHAAVGPVRG